MKKILITIGIILISVILYGFFINTKGFNINEKTITTDKISEAFNGFKIVQFSDLLIGSTKNTADLESIVTKINNLKPDIVVFTGDLISKNYDVSESEISKVKELLKEIECNLYKYAIIGDNDQNNLDLYQDIMKSSDFKLLDNSSTYIFYKDITPIKLTGITDITKLNEALIDKDDIITSYNILLTHYPDDFEIMADQNIDLVLAGHSLKGQIIIPFYGPLLKKDKASTYLEGYYEKSYTKMYVSGGLGTETINFRLFNKPEINLYRLEKR